MSRIILSEAKPNIALATHVEKRDIWVRIVPKVNHLTQTLFIMILLSLGKTKLVLVLLE